MQSGPLPSSTPLPYPPPSESTLCELCRNINIETLSLKGGYVHSTLDVLNESAASCELCNVFRKSFDRKMINWTLGRYKLKLSFSPPRDQGHFSDHRELHFIPKHVSVEVVTKAQFRGKYKELESDDPSGKERSIHGRHMLCFTEKGDPAMYSGMPWLRKIGVHTGSPSSLQVAKGWLDQCVATETSGHAHGDSGQNATKSLMDNSDKDLGASPFRTKRPTRLLEIHRHHDSDLPGSTVKLINTYGGVYPYAALSYCWGNQSGIWLTETNTIEQHLRGIERSSLPATINDAVDIVAALGIEYLWVDALCIIQDSEDDWKVESAKMGEIYQGGLLTIAASKSASSDDGCFNTNRAHGRTVFSDYINVQGRLKDGSASNLYFERFINSVVELKTGRFGIDIQGSPLSQRAWTYQEQVLSSRILYFAESQLYWECDHCRLSEDNLPQAHAEREYPVLTFSNSSTMESTGNEWYRGAVQTYSKRRLTYQRDKLTAISAVAKATYLKRRVAYVAGLWEDSMIRGLGWYRSSPGKKEKDVPCPSWSWASQHSGVLYDMGGPVGGVSQFISESPTLPQVLSFDVETEETNPFGDVSNGHITLRTMVTTGQILPGKKGRMRDNYLHGYEDTSILTIGENPDLKEWQARAVLDDDGNEGQNVTVAFLSDWDKPQTMWKLLLLKQASGQEHAYQRVGIALIGQDYLCYDGWYHTREFRRKWKREVLVII